MGARSGRPATRATAEWLGSVVLTGDAMFVAPAVYSGTDQPTLFQWTPSGQRDPIFGQGGPLIVAGLDFPLTPTGEALVFTQAYIRFDRCHHQRPFSGRKLSA